MHNCTCPHPSHQRKALEKIKEAWNENPLMVIGVVAVGMTATARLIEAVSGISSKWAYATRIKR